MPASAGSVGRCMATAGSACPARVPFTAATPPPQPPSLCKHGVLGEAQQLGQLQEHSSQGEHIDLRAGSQRNAVLRKGTAVVWRARLCAAQTRPYAARAGGCSLPDTTSQRQLPRLPPHLQRVAEVDEQEGLGVLAAHQVEAGGGDLVGAPAACEAALQRDLVQPVSWHSHGEGREEGQVSQQAGKQAARRAGCAAPSGCPPLSSTAAAPRPRPNSPPAHPLTRLHRLLAGPHPQLVHQVRNLLPAALLRLFVRVCLVRVHAPAVNAPNAARDACKAMDARAEGRVACMQQIVSVRPALAARCSTREPARACRAPPPRPHQCR